ncbi:glycosyltransferase 87 family protein [Corynebacterium epidermidicanis]|uniref:Putative DUF2029 family protein n=1 Tax=Corynebacterium epidermidicanis TaxID=1050174 RepID=A0A0G3GQX7_9CORY|nr:glycosyltransferase 87 family protein [Corynebacterium epidermidicanis]AKK03539.1 putative DUF2029 family protein [Corynebacterium epidermidicanis]
MSSAHSSNKTTLGWICGTVAAAVVCFLATFRIELPAATLHARNFIDATVYAGGGAKFWSNTGVYSSAVLTANGPLEFTYPPFAALLFGPMALLPPWLLGPVMAVVSLLITAGVSYWWSRAISRPHAAGWIFGLLALSQPMTATLFYGQINAVLVGLVVADAALAQRGSKYRGVFSGLAAAIKLTPAVFVLWFIARRDWRGAVNMLLSAIVATLSTALIRPHDSWQFFTKLLIETNRVGDLSYYQNLALRGVLARMSQLPEGAASKAWLLAVAATIVLAYLGSRAVLRTAPSVAFPLSLAAVGFVGLLISPISWSHHWLWLPLVAVALYQIPRLRFLGLVGFILSTVGALHSVAPHLGAWTSALYATYGVAVLVAICVPARQLTTAGRPPM